MITKLTLTNFRNHESFRIETESRNIALIGPNGVGKTNVLEAISLLNGGTGLRKDTPAEIARYNTTDFAVNAELSDGNVLTIHWENGMPGRRAKVNGSFSILGELAHYVSIIWLTPREDLLFMDAPSDRRAFFDNLIAGFDAHHVGRTMRLSKLISERAFALKNNPDGSWLDIIEENITSVAVAVADARIRWARELANFFEDGEIHLRGLIEEQLLAGAYPGDIETSYKEYLAENRFLTADKQVIDGAHKTDFWVLNRALKRYADKTSTGQQKILLSKLIIANAELLAAKNPSRPILVLLDEADGHLDKAHRKALFAALEDTPAQVWITGTNPILNAKCLMLN